MLTRNLFPLHQELISWYHRIYHLPFHILFRLASMDFLPKRLLEFRNKPPLFFACQFSAAPCRTWRTKGDKSGSVRRPEQSEPGNGILVDHIVSSQPGSIPQISGFLTSQHFWGCTNFVDHVSDYVYVNLMRDLSLSETLLTK